MTKPMNILFPVSECYPFAKTGGLADVAGALPQALAALQQRVAVVMPLYQKVWHAKIVLAKTEIRLQIPLGHEQLGVEVWKAQTPAEGPEYYFLNYPPFYDRPDLYATPFGEYVDNDRRYLMLCRGALELGKALNRQWDIVHCHDWHTGLIPAYLQTLYQQEPCYAKTKTLFTIHNLQYQGHFDPEVMNLAHLPWDHYTSDRLEFWGGVNFMKSALCYADWVNAVSPTYAQEIQTPEYGCGLDGVVRTRRQTVSGILNGVDYAVWNPETDAHLPHTFSGLNPESKKKTKTALLEEVGLYPLDDAPLIGIISRLEDQKGFDILSHVGERLMQLPIQMIVLGVGSKRYHDFFLWLKAHFPRKLSLHLEFSERLAHLIYGGSDLFLMPSRFEPCGLGQLISMRYGTVPVVRHTGGLADSVQNVQDSTGNGFSFFEYNGESLYQTIRRALGIYNEKKTWRTILKNAMNADFSWERSAREYLALYHRLAGKQ